MPTLDNHRCQEIAGVIQRMGYTPDKRSVTPFENDPVSERSFLFFMVAIDHKTHGEKRYEEGTAHGSDLMVKKAGEAALKEPGLWTCEGVLKLTTEKAARIFATGEGVTPTGMQRRVELMTSAAKFLKAKYAGDVRNVFEQAENTLAGQGGVIERLAECPAYADPLQKKTQLLLKLLWRRKLVEIKDVENMGAPPDHVLMTSVLRSGMVNSGELAAKLRAGEKLTDKELWELRDATRQAVKEVAVRAQMDIGDVDDLFWGMGRETTALSLPIGRGDILKIRTVMDNRCKNAQAREEFLQTICAQEEVARQFPVPVYAETDFF